MKHPPRNHWPAERPQMWPLSKIKPYPKNPRAHSQEQVAALAAAMREDGVTMPILVDEKGEVIAGHARLLAAQENKFKKYPVAVARGWTDVQKRAARVRDNQLSLLSQWDDDLLRLEVGSLKMEGYDLLSLGFDSKTISSFLGSQTSDRDPDIVPPLPQKPIARLGDIWTLGRHRIICGDSTIATVARALMEDQQADLILTDPPYCSGGFQEAGKAGGSVGTDAPHKQVANDRLSTRGFQQLIKAGISHIGAPYLYAFTDWRMWIWLFDVAESSGYGVRSMIVWDKGTPGMGKGWRAQHELILFGAKKVPPFKYTSGIGNVVRCQRTGNKFHTTEKPVELLVKLLQTTEFAEIVADPFLGSGSTLMACEISERTRCFGAELDPAYVDCAILRWQNHSGKLATCEGKTLEELRAARHSGKPISRKRQNGAGKRRGVRPGLHDRRPAARGEPAGEPPIVAGDS